MMQVELRRLTEVPLEELAALFNHPAVRRHLPLAKGRFTEASCARFVRDKERMWETHGYGPWAFFVAGEFAGWGGLQPDGRDADLGIVLHRRFWGMGYALVREILMRDGAEVGESSMTVLLPPTRVRVRALGRMGFEPDGESVIDGERFIRYRLGDPRKWMGTTPPDIVQRPLGLPLLSRSVVAIGQVRGSP